MAEYSAFNKKSASVWVEWQACHNRLSDRDDGAFFLAEKFFGLCGGDGGAGEYSGGVSGGGAWI